MEQNSNEIIFMATKTNIFVECALTRVLILFTSTRSIWHQIILTNYHVIDAFKRILNFNGENFWSNKFK